MLQFDTKFDTQSNDAPSLVMAIPSASSIFGLRLMSLVDKISFCYKNVLVIHMTIWDSVEDYLRKSVFRPQHLWKSVIEGIKCLRLMGETRDLGIL